MVEEKQEYEMGLPNGVGEQMLAHAYEKFDIKLEQTEFVPGFENDALNKFCQECNNEFDI